MPAGIVMWTALMGMGAAAAVRKFRRVAGLRPVKAMTTFVDNTGEKPVRAGLLLPLSAKIARTIARRRRFR